ncbi:multiple antibiotic resistance protein [Parvibaculum indicum]|uniref:MarC family protein n=1 Tax=Parvibaculum indicum TaxID=562969 RepID=UPI00141E1BC1|nr:MarC family protein [Parvibaculum indicum]NIJ42217.1 multiple antibiotic resistance protein [Parvibaculum indicum]
MLEENIAFAATCLAGYFAIANPIANTPVFIALTAGDSRKVRFQIARQSVLISLAVVVLFSVAGKLIFELFGVTIAALRITGGVLVAIIGFQMLQGHSSSAHVPEEVEDEDVPTDVIEAQLSVSVSPLAIPMIAGPGTIATAVGFSAHPGVLSSIISICAFAVIAAITYFCFRQAPRIVHYMGTTNLTVVTRLMGLIVATIGVEMAMTGMDEALIKYMDTIRSLPLPPPTG